MALALFDLDNTLIGGDSDHLWGEFLADNNRVDAEAHRIQNDIFYQKYRQGTLDIQAFLKFSLEPLSRYPLTTLKTWHTEFMSQYIKPVMLPKAFELLDKHRLRGDTLIIITATNDFVTQPIADALDVPHLLATSAEKKQNRYTGKVLGTPCFQEGKITRLNNWLRENPHTMENSFFYSDSFNDLPLLNRVTHPTAVDPDLRLKTHAQKNNWPVISLRT
jgi:HAD superfamily hydrolase (TIGR01490 family)